jgi:cyanate permease
MITNVASLFFGFALFASLIGTAAYVEAPTATGYGFGSSFVVGGLAMLLLAPVAARLITRRGATVVGMGTGIGYAAMPSLIGARTPQKEPASANGLNTLTRSIGSSLASAVGGSIMAASTISPVPSSSRRSLDTGRCSRYAAAPPCSPEQRSC